MPNLCWISPGRVVIVKFVQVAARIRRSVSVYAFSRRLFAMPPMLSHIERVNQVRLLGVLFNSPLKATFRVDTVLSIINQRLYLLSQLKAQWANTPCCKTQKNKLLEPAENRRLHSMRCAMHIT